MRERKLVELPEHVNPSSGDRTACAPYNFIPLPEMVVTVVDSADELPCHDRFYPDQIEGGENEKKAPRYTGYFTVTLKTLSPLYIRCGLSNKQGNNQPSEFEMAELEKLGQRTKSGFRDAMKNKPDFFFTHKPEQPVIPGSSLRGMLRAVLEIVSYGKLQAVNDKQIFYRAVGEISSLGDSYRERMQQQIAGGYCPTANAGYVSRRGNSYFLTPAREIHGVQYFRVDESIATSSISDLAVMRRLSNPRRGRPYYEPNPDYKWLRRKIWFQPVHPATHRYHTRPMYYGDVSSLQKVEPVIQKDKWVSGVLIASGWIPAKYPKLGKHLHWIINEKGTGEIPIADADILAYKDGGGITDKINDEGLVVLPQEGEEVACFYIVWQDSNGQQHTTLGHTPFFRLPYEGAPLDYVPEDLRREEEIDYAEAIFGYTKKKGVGKEKAYASRVFVTDAILKEASGGLWLSNDAITPKILATPKPTCFQHYLVQQEPNRIEVGTRRDGTPRRELRLRHFASPTSEQTVIRGHKLYWHKSNRHINDIEENDPNSDWLGEDGRLRDNSTQHTQFRPVNTDVTFSFRVYFENLSGKELGALCWALHPLGDEQIRQNPKQGYCHSLGMGKPLGMGAIKLDATLYLTKWTERYQKLFDGTRWVTGATAGEKLVERTPLVKQMTDAFESGILNALKPFKGGKECARLADLKRIAMLLKMMEWPGIPPQLPATPENRVRNTRQMLIQHGQTGNEFKKRPVLPDPSAFGDLTGYAQPESDSAPANGAPTKPNTAVGAPNAFHSAKTTPPKHPQGAVTMETLLRAQEKKQVKPIAAFSGKKKEVVTLLTAINNGKAEVQIGESEQVLCKNFPPHASDREVRSKCHAEVSYDKGKAVSAVFKRWV